MDCRVEPGNDEGRGAILPLAGEGIGFRGSIEREKGAGRAGRRPRVRCGGDGQRHGNLLEHANTLAQMLDETLAPCPACSFDPRRRTLTDGFALWNVVTHGYKLQISFLFCSNQNRAQSQ